MKAKQDVTDRDLRGVRALKEEGILNRHLVVSMENTVRQKEDGVTILPWADFLKRLWQGEFD